MITKELLYNLRYNKHMTKVQIAQLLGISKTALSNYYKKYDLCKKTEYIEKICPICGKHFIIRIHAKNKTYCSVKCGIIGRQKVKQKECLNCGKPFKPYYRNSEFCCRTCKKEYKEKQNNIIYTKYCEYCGKPYFYYNNMSNWFAPDQCNGKKYHGVDSSKYCSYKCGIAHRQEVSRKTCLLKYGVEFTAASQNNLEKSRITKLKQYGNPYYVNGNKIRQTFSKKSKEEKIKIRLKVKKTKLLRYGDENYSGNRIFTEEQLQQRAIKVYNTKKKNNSFIGKGNINGIKCSLAEQSIYNTLYLHYSDIEFEKFIKTYGSCDFYIPALDLYIEYQGTWTHGTKPFEGTKEDLEKVQKWKQKDKPYYKQAIYTWTKLDVKKREAAKKLGLNWIEFFNMEQFENWFKNLSTDNSSSNKKA